MSSDKILLAILDPVTLKTLAAHLQKTPSIEQKYADLGGAAGLLGDPLDGEKEGAKDGKYREYQNGAIYWRPSIGAHEVHGDILKKYKLLGAEGSFLGYPTTDVLATPDGGYHTVFEGGAILWKPVKAISDPEFQPATPPVWAFEVHGAILAKYKELHAYAGPLGYPVTDELDTGDGSGRVSYFQGGEIYWTPQTAAHAVYGAIRAKYRFELDSFEGFLGYPLTDELGTPDGVGRFNHFQGGSIYWTPSTGPHEVHGEIRDLWATMGWEKSWLGYPISDELAIPGTDGRRSIFVGGAVDLYPGEAANPIQHFYDLKALDWCYKLSPSKNHITFFPVVANVGTQTVVGPGEFDIGVTVDENLVVGTPSWAPRKIPPSFRLEPGSTAVLEPGVTVPFKEESKYSWLEYRFNIAGEPIQDFCEFCFLDDLRTGKNNNGRTFFHNRAGADIGYPNEPRDGGWIVHVSGKERGWP